MDELFFHDETRVEKKILYESQIQWSQTNPTRLSISILIDHAWKNESLREQLRMCDAM